MYHAATMRLVQGVCDFDCEFQRFVQRQWSPLEPGSQRFPFQVLHDEVVGPFMAADIKKDADVRVI